MATVSKQEYLKRYISGPEADVKKKKRRKKLKSGGSHNSRVRIYDDDLTLDKLGPTDDMDTLLLEEVGEEAPMVDGVIDDRPDYVKRAEMAAKWKGFTADDDDESPSHRKLHDSDSDNSPARSRKQRHDSSGSEDNAVPFGKNTNLDASPPPRKRRSSDQSPPRKTVSKRDSRKRHDSDSDQSPARNIGHGSDSDQSPARKKGKASDSDQSPPRKRGQASDSDQSPPRKRGQASDSDQSPPRKRGSRKSDSPVRKIDSGRKRERKSRWANLEDVDDKGRTKKTLSGANAGLSSATAMREETKRLRAKEDEAFKKIDAEKLGKGADTVVRRHSKKYKKGEEDDDPAEIARKAAQKEQYDKWGKGLAQQEQHNTRVAEALREVDKPLARGRDDQDLEQHLKEQLRDGDPMLAMLTKKKDKPKKQGGATVVMPRYKGRQPPPNRFEVWPGYRWDGVDRSNGFEKKFFTTMVTKQAQVEDAYKWSVEDM